MLKVIEMIFKLRTWGDKRNLREQLQVDREVEGRSSASVLVDIVAALLEAVGISVKGFKEGWSGSVDFAQKRE